MERLMDRCRWIMILCMLGSLLLAGCSARVRPLEGKNAASNTSDTTMVEDIDFSFLEEEEGSWRDNSLDDWQALINRPTQPYLLEGEDQYSYSTLIGEGGLLFFSNHYLNSTLQWSGINGITVKGEEFSHELHIESDENGEPFAYGFGVVSGGEGYVAGRNLFEDGKLCGYCFYGLDENLKLLWTKQVESIDGHYLNSIMQDGEGNLHVLLYDEECLIYVIYSPDGKLIFHQTEKLSAGFYQTEDGGVFVRRRTLLQQTIDYGFYQADLDTGEIKKINSFNGARIKTKKEMFTLDVTMKSEHEILWCGQEGVYLYDDRTEEEKMLYRWANHGLYPNQVIKMMALKEGRIGILYNDVEGPNFLYLKPTEEKVEERVLTIAVSPKNKGVFSGAAAYFSKRHPEYTIIIKDDYDETSLLTQLGAGDGPIIVDTALTGFEDLQELWQPLDGFLEKSGVMNELIPEVMKAGKIGERTYGIVTNFYIRTLIVSDPAITDWDYEGYLNYLETHGEMGVFSDSYIGGEPNFQKIFFDSLNNGLSDNYYVNVTDDSMIFGTEEFDRVLRLSQKAKKGYHATMGVPLRDGRVACEIVEVFNASSLDQLRERLEESGEYLIGFPSRDGARHLLVTGAPVAVRCTCTDEEKIVAYTFLRDMLTKAALSAPNYHSAEGSNRDSFRVRQDVLEDLFQEYDRRQAIDSFQGKIPATVEEYQKAYDEALENQKREGGAGNRELMQKLISGGTIKKTFPAALENVFQEELGEYERGIIDDAMVTDHLKNRFRIYLEEMK